MNIYLKGEYHEQRAFAEQDKQYLVHLFGEIGSGMETVHLTERKEYRATHHINTDDYPIYFGGSTKSEKLKKK